MKIQYVSHLKFEKKNLFTTAHKPDVNESQITGKLCQSCNKHANRWADGSNLLWWLKRRLPVVIEAVLM